MSNLSKKIVKKSVNAVLSALEIYNKPNCNYREETFSILIVNAYELLFKAKLIKDSNEKMNAIYVYYYPKTKKGNSSKQKQIKKNRIGQPFTIDIYEAINRLEKLKLISNNLIENIKLMIEIRDNSIHLINKELLKGKLYQLSSASIRNYVLLLEKWFPEINLKQYHFFITPLNFDEIVENYDTVSLNLAQKSFLKYIELADNTSEKEDEFDLLVKVDIKFVRNDKDESILLKYAHEGKKIEVELTEEMFKKMYPFDFKEMQEKVKEKCPQLKFDKKFNCIKNKMHMEGTGCRDRFLDFRKQKGTKKTYYNTAFVDKIIQKYQNNI